MNKLIMPHMPYPQSGAYLGEPGEMVFDTTFKTVRVHDGETPGGTILPRHAPTTSALAEQLGRKIAKMDIGVLVPGLDERGKVLEEAIRHDSYLRDPHNDQILARKNGEWVAIDIPEHTFVPGGVDFVGGDVEAGYYGHISSDMLINHNVLAGRLGITGTPYTSGEKGWMKFSLDGKTLFVATSDILTTSYEQLYRAGVVYGTDDAGLAPVGDPVNQNTILRLWGHDYRVRLLKGASADPIETSGSSVTNHESQLGSEWDRLMHRIDSRVSSSQVGDNWVSYPFSIIGSRASWTQEQAIHPDDETDYRVCRIVGYSNNTTFSYQPTTTRGWRPVLELIE